MTTPQRTQHFGIVPSRHFFLVDNATRLHSVAKAIDPLSAMDSDLGLIILYVLTLEGTSARIIRAASITNPINPLTFIEETWEKFEYVGGVPDRLICNQRIFDHLPALRTHLEHHGVQVESVSGNKKHSGMLVGAERQTTPGNLDIWHRRQVTSGPVQSLNSALHTFCDLHGQIAKEDWTCREVFGLPVRKPDFRTMTPSDTFTPGPWLWPATLVAKLPITDEEVRGAKEIESILDDLTQLGMTRFPWDIKDKYPDTPAGHRAIFDETTQKMEPFATRFYNELRKELEEIVAFHPPWREEDPISISCDAHMVPHVCITAGQIGMFRLRRGLQEVSASERISIIDDTWLLQEAALPPVVNRFDREWLGRVGFQIAAWGWRDESALIVSLPVWSEHDVKQLRLALSSPQRGNIERLMKKAKITVYCDSALKGYVAKNAWNVLLRCLGIHPDGHQAPQTDFALERRFTRWKIDRREISKTLVLFADLQLAIEDGFLDMKGRESKTSTTISS